MNQRDITAVITGIAPVIHSYFEERFSKVALRLDAVEKREPIAGEPGPPGKDADASLLVDRVRNDIILILPSMIAAELAKIQLPKDGAPGHRRQGWPRRRWP
jgi:hypothetical protein